MKNFILGLMVGVLVATLCSFVTASIFIGGIILGALIVKVLS